MGGKGGNGGLGGAAGNGGNGGNGADIYVYYVSDQSAGQPPVLTARGGAAGSAGKPGLGGAPGAQGDWGGDTKYGNATCDPTRRFRAWTGRARWWAARNPSSWGRLSAGVTR